MSSLACWMCRIDTNAVACDGVLHFRLGMLGETRKFMYSYRNHRHAQTCSQAQRHTGRLLRVARTPMFLHVNVNVNGNNLLAISKLDFDNSGEPGPQAKGVNHLETPLRQLHATHRASSCAKRGGHMQLCSKPRGGTRNRTQDLPKKG